MAYTTFESKVLRFIRKEKLIRENDRVLIALSGGVDSMVLLHVLHRLHFNVSAAHCNFGLRSDESDRDEAFCEEQCRIEGIPFTSKKFETKATAISRKISTQMAARELRYEWFSQLISAHGHEYVATAHHAGDQAETVLMHLIDGKSMHSLQGIPLRNGRVIRPLLPFSKEALMQYAMEKKITWREDSSNEQKDYRRNYIRHQIIPSLKVLNPSIEETLVRFAGKLRPWNHLADTMADKLTASLSEEKNGLTRLHFSSLLQNPAADVLLLKLLAPFGFGSSAVESILENPHNSGSFFESHSHQLHIDRDEFIIEKKTAEEAFQFCEVHSEGVDTKDFSIGVEISAVTGMPEHFPEDPQIACFDALKIAFPLSVTHWMEGDSFYPLGMVEPKKLSDYFIDRKIPVPEKRQKLIVRNGEDIIWIVGERIDHRYRVTEETRQCLTLRFSSNQKSSVE